MAIDILQVQHQFHAIKNNSFLIKAPSNWSTITNTHKNECFIFIRKGSKIGIHITKTLRTIWSTHGKEAVIYEKKEHYMDTCVWE